MQQYQPSPSTGLQPDQPGLPPCDDAAAAGLIRALAVAGMRHPRCALPLYERALQRAQDLPLLRRVQLLQGLFFSSERLGRAAPLRPALHQALAEAQDAGLIRQVTRLHEALGRLSYQAAEYQQASAHWSEALDLATLQPGSLEGVAPCIGLAQLHFALGDWQTGQHLLLDAQSQLRIGAPQLAARYLQAKLLINLGVAQFNRSEFAQARTSFEQGQRWARSIGHRDYVAESQWHLARCAQASGEESAARQLCEQALQSARRCGYVWLEAMASATLTELAMEGKDWDHAIQSGEQALALARSLGARRQQSSAHKALAQLYQHAGRLSEALDQLWQHQALEAELYRLSLPERLSALVRFDHLRQGPEERMLALSNQHFSVETPEDLRLALLQMREQVLAIMGLDDWTVWWDEGSQQRFVSIAQAGKPEDLGLDAEHCGDYLQMLADTQEPLVIRDMRLHPHGALLLHRPRAQSKGGRIEVPLRLQQQLRGILWLQRESMDRAWTREDLLSASHLAKICERLLLSLDLTRAKAARQELEQEKFASLGRMVASIAHDVNTPIGVAITAASGVADHARRLGRVADGSEKLTRSELQALAAQLSNAADLVDRNLQRAATLMGDFKRIAVDQNAEAPQRLALKDYLQSVLSVHSPALRRARVDCRLEVEDSLQVQTVPGLLSQILSNLIMNSLTHAFPEGQGGCLSLRAQACGPQLRIDYADNGVGLSEAARTHVFEPFFTTRRGQGGSGLGMYIVANLAKRLGGQALLMRPDRGFALRLELPLQGMPASGDGR
ncbi:ATP-binding protein [Roseateles sp. DB2]|uniref:ATP-binding protein n=1 Tax=Roseateles sp. DB2 TaxID=3453717 RepID=UPI003EEA5ADC